MARPRAGHALGAALRRPHRSLLRGASGQRLRSAARGGGPQPGRRSPRLRPRASDLRRPGGRRGAMRRRPRGCRRRQGRPSGHAARQRLAVSGRAVLGAAPRRHRRAAECARADARHCLHARPFRRQAAGLRCRASGSPAGARSDAAAGASRRGRGRPPFGGLASAGRADRSGTRRRRRGRHGHHPLYLGHDRPAEGCHADASQHLPLGHALRISAWGSHRATGPSWPCP